MSKRPCVLSVSIIFLCLMVHPLWASTTVKIVDQDVMYLLYEPFGQRLYGSVPSSDAVNGNSVVVIDPVSGVVEDSIFVGSEPRRMAMSGDGEYIYVALDGSGKVCRINIPSGIVDQEFALGTGFFGTMYGEDIAVQPGNPNVIAVSRYRKGVSPRHDGVAIYDNGIKRPQETADHTGSNRIEWSDSAQIIYGYNNETTDFGLRTMVVSEYGVATTSTKYLISGFSVDIEYEDGYLYSTNGRVVDLQLMQMAGQFGASGVIEPDATVRRTFFVNGATVSAYNQKTFLLDGQYTVSGASGSPRDLVRWGNKGLAYCTSGKQVVILETDIVPDPPVLTDLIIQGPNSVPGYKAQYKLIVTFDDGVVLDVTQKARWYTDPNTYTEVDGAGWFVVFGTSQAGTTVLNAQYVWAGATHHVAKNISYAGTIPATGNLIDLKIQGPNEVPKNSSTQLSAIAYFDDGTSYDVTANCLWTMEPSDFASIDAQGLLTVGEIDRYRDVVLYADFGHRYDELQAIKTILCSSGGGQIGANNWPMFQGNPQHTGYIPTSLEPDEFSFRWEKQVANGFSLHPVAAANGKVFVSLHLRFDDIASFFTLDARDGEILWFKDDFGRINRMNPPAYAYGNVYVQTGKESSSGVPPYLHAFDADTGEVVFKSSFSAQWEQYFAPTVYDGSVYINGGYYGGMYGYGAFSGVREWFLDLAQYDKWTPAVEGAHAYAYVGGLLSAVNRLHGTVDFTISDPNFDWHGWSMGLAPVLSDNRNILVIQDARLVCFDLRNQSIRYELPGSYVGQASVAKSVVYAINGGSLEARDENDGRLLWNWNPPEGSLTGTMIITDTHVLTRTSANTYAVEILGRNSDWSYPASGHLALGNETLYIARADGILTAIATPEYIPATPDRIEIEGPNQIPECSTTPYKATVYYSDGRVRNRTALCTWSLQANCLAALNEDATLSVGELLYPRQTLTLRAEYTQGETTICDEMEVQVYIGIEIEALVARNLEKAMQSKEKILYELQQAIMYEQASSDIVQVLRESKSARIGRPDLNKAQNQISLAMVDERNSNSFIQTSVESLTTALEIFAPESPVIEIIQGYLQTSDEGQEYVELPEVSGATESQPPAEETTARTRKSESSGR